MDDELPARVNISSATSIDSKRDSVKSPGSDSSFDRWMAKPTHSPGGDSPALESSMSMDDTSSTSPPPPPPAPRVPSAIRELEENEDDELVERPKPAAAVPFVRTMSASPALQPPAPPAAASPIGRAVSASPAVRASPAAPPPVDAAPVVTALSASALPPRPVPSPALATSSSAPTAPSPAPGGFIRTGTAFAATAAGLHPTSHLVPPGLAPAASPVPAIPRPLATSPAPATSLAPAISPVPPQAITVPLPVAPSSSTAAPAASSSPSFYTVATAARAAVAFASPFRVVTPVPPPGAPGSAGGSHAPSPAPPAASPAGTPVPPPPAAPATVVPAGSVQPLFPGHRVAIVAGSSARVVETRRMPPRAGPRPAPAAPAAFAGPSPPAAAPVRAFHVDVPPRPAPQPEPPRSAPEPPRVRPAPPAAERIRVPPDRPLSAPAGREPAAAGDGLEELVLRLALAAALEDLYPPVHGTTCALAPPAGPSRPRFRPPPPATSMAINYGAPIVRPSAADLERPSLGIHGRLPTAPADADFLTLPRAPVVRRPLPERKAVSVARPTVDRSAVSDRYSRLLTTEGDTLAAPLEAYIYEQRQTVLAGGRVPTAPPSLVDAALRETVTEVLKTREVAGLIRAATARKIHAAAR